MTIPKIIASLLLVALLVSVYGQERISGKITSCKDQKALAFAAIFRAKDLTGTTSNENGEFHLALRESDSTDSISVSYVGFKTVKMPASAFAKNGNVCLEESSVMLNEVVVRTQQLDHRKLFEKFRIVKGDLYAQESETSIGEFNVFLKEMEGTPSFAKYDYDLSSYSGSVKEFYQRYHSNVPELKHGRRFSLEEGNYVHYPAVNVTHEAALAYCQWLTDEYNNQKKRKFKKVKFRLPTLSEWQIAALGYPNFQSWNLDENDVKVHVPYDSTKMIGTPGKDIFIKASDILYPWHGAYYYRRSAQNSKNCFMGNFKVPENYTPCFFPKVAGDGFAMMGHVTSYFPNDVGLYDVVGNVAEMIDQQGRACGGSWNQLPMDCTIRSVATYGSPNSWVGFRVFMEVLEK